MQKRDILSLDLQELLNQPLLAGFRAKQVYSWLHNKKVKSFDDMSNLSLSLREELSNIFYIERPEVVKESVSKDWTVKKLLKFKDGQSVEAVYMADNKGRETICVSTQSGCAMGCLFCATGGLGFERNLTTGEILSQIYAGGEPDNIVFMGMGEPFLNYDNVIKAVKILNSENGSNIGARKMTISTCGIIEGIERLAKEEIQVRLAISVNSAIQKKREALMPIAKKVSLDELKSALISYQAQTGRRITFEYVLIRDKNDSEEDLFALADYSKGLSVNVNIIPMNSFSKELLAPYPNVVDHFISSLKDRGIEAVKRISRGGDIMAACGQLARD